MAGKIKGMFCDKVGVLTLRIYECLMMDLSYLVGHSINYALIHHSVHSNPEGRIPLGSHSIDLNNFMAN